MKNKKIQLITLLSVVFVIVLGVAVTVIQVLTKPQVKIPEELVATPTVEQPVVKQEDVIRKAKISANGDLLYHERLIKSAYNDGEYNFDENYQAIKSFISSMDLAIANYEGTINDDFPIKGGGVNLIFNAPKQVVSAIKNAGYDAISLANNHIADSHDEGIVSTYNYFKDAGFTVFGTEMEKNSPIVIKEVNGIKVALLAYSESFNGMEATISDATYYRLFFTNDEDRIKKDIEQAKQLADYVIVYPHMGIEYQLEPNQTQKNLYHKMVEWGADAVLGNHPHVVQPSEVVEVAGQKKLIVYSMGNLISNQRLETIDDEDNVAWTERGVIVELEIMKKNDEPTVLENIKFHPTWVRRKYRNTDASGYQKYQYTVLMTEDYVDNRQDLTDDEYNRVKNTHTSILEHISN